MRIAVVGSGYVGLTTAAGLADFGNHVICMDIDIEKIDSLKQGKVPFYEPGLSDLVNKNVKNKTLIFTTDIKVAITKADVVFIAVGTPPKKDGSADLSYVMAAAKSIGQSITNWVIVVTKSTVPIGTTEKVFEVIKAETSIPFAIANNPEFLKEGDAINDMMKPDRVVVGVEDERAKKLLKKLYIPLTKTLDRLLIMDIRSSELTKYASNALLASRLSFMNSLANLCEKANADIDQIRLGVGTDSRIGQRFLYASGVGFGGSCFSKDVSALQFTANQFGVHLDILKATADINMQQKIHFIDKIKKHYNGKISGKTICMLGLSFKPNTDDIRDAPALTIIDLLLENNVIIQAYDPAAMEWIKKQYGNNIKLFNSIYDAAKNTDAILVITEWKEFRSPDFAQLKNVMNDNPAIFDGRNIWSDNEMCEYGFKYYGTGKGTKAQ